MGGGWEGALLRWYFKQAPPPARMQLGETRQCDPGWDDLWRRAIASSTGNLPSAAVTGGPRPWLACGAETQSLVPVSFSSALQGLWYPTGVSIRPGSLATAVGSGPLPHPRPDWLTDHVGQGHWCSGLQAVHPWGVTL